MPALPIVRGTCTIGHSITQLIDPLPSACAHSSGKRGRHRGYMSDGVGARKTLAGAFGLDGLSSAQKFGRGGLVACAWRCDLARGARRSPSRCVCVACAACRVSRACLSGGVGAVASGVRRARVRAANSACKQDCSWPPLSHGNGAACAASLGRASVRALGVARFSRAVPRARARESGQCVLQRLGQRSWAGGGWALWAWEGHLLFSHITELY